MAEEYFYGITLEGEKAGQIWDLDAKKKEDLQGDNRLIITQALLGLGAVQGEANVIQVETLTWKKTVKIPIAELTAGLKNQILLDLTFPEPPVEFTLAHGTGPVHIVGREVIGSPLQALGGINRGEEENLGDDEAGNGGKEDENERLRNKKSKSAPAAPQIRTKPAKNKSTLVFK